MLLLSLWSQLLVSLVQHDSHLETYDCICSKIDDEAQYASGRGNVVTKLLSKYDNNQ